MTNDTDVLVRDLVVGVSLDNASASGLEVVASHGASIRHVAITQSDSNAVQAGLLAYGDSDLALDSLRVYHVRHIAVLVRRPRSFFIGHSDIRRTLPDSTGQAFGIQVDSLKDTTLASPSWVGYGRITANYLDSVPTQGIFVQGLDSVVVDHNGVYFAGIGSPSCTQDCHGRGIYVENGTAFWIFANYLYGVGDDFVGGGIHAGTRFVRDLIIEYDTVRNAGNASARAISWSDADRKERIGPGPADWNGWGISVHTRALVQYNLVEYPASYGLLIEPGADSVEVVNNQFRYAGVNNIKAVAGYLNAGSDSDVLLAPVGGLRAIVIRDNVVAYAQRAGINIEARQKADMLQPEYWPSDNSWADYRVTTLDNSLQHNDWSAYFGDWINGLRYLASDNVPSVSDELCSPVNGPCEFTSYASSAYNGQRYYINADAGVNLLPVGNATLAIDFSALQAKLEAISPRQ